MLNFIASILDQCVALQVLYLKSIPSSSKHIQNITKYFSSDDYRKRSSLSFRGPDEQLVVRNENLVVNFRRLTIFNYQKLNSPYLSSCGRYSTLMNGEIYSVKEKAYELNIPFNLLECDSQILAEIYSRQGTNGFCKSHMVCFCWLCIQ